MDPEQVWAQLELRAEGLCRIIKEVAQPEADDEEGSVMGWEEEEDEEDSTEDMTVEEWEKMMAEGGYEEGMSDEGSEEDSEMGSDEDEDVEMGSEDKDELELGSDDEGLLDDDEEEGEGEGEGDDDEGEEDEDEDGSDDADAEAFAPGPSKPRKAQHPTLDDTFFSIDDFNRQTEEMEAGRVTTGALGGDEDEDAELDDVGAMFLEEGEDEDAPLMYSDFFEAPRPTAPVAKGKGKEREDGKKKKRRVAFADDDEEPEVEEEDPSRGVMDRVKADLFDDSDDEGNAEQSESPPSLYSLGCKTDGSSVDA